MQFPADNDHDVNNTWRLCDGEGSAHQGRMISSPMGGSSAENIWMASGDGDIDRVLEILSDDPTQINAQDDNGYSPL